MSCWGSGGGERRRDGRMGGWEMILGFGVLVPTGLSSAPGNEEGGDGGWWNACSGLRIEFAADFPFQKAMARLRILGSGSKVPLVRRDSPPHLMRLQ